MLGPIGGSEVILILALALLLFGPRKLPELGRTLGRTMTQLRKAAFDFKVDLEREIKTEEMRTAERDLKDAGREISRIASDATRPEPAPRPDPKRSETSPEER